MATREFRCKGIKYHPVKLGNPWKTGYALDLHTVSSVPDGFGGFNTERSPVGQLLYDLKYGGQKKNAGKIARVMADWIWRTYPHHRIDCLAAVPPSERRAYQPVLEILKKLSELLAIENCSSRIKKVKQTRSLKALFDPGERRRELSNAFQVDAQVADERILLVDDLFRSGETAEEVRRALKAAGAKDILLITATKTRVHR
jgi:competence protein ComFC